MGRSCTGEFALGGSGAGGDSSGFGTDNAAGLAVPASPAIPSEVLFCCGAGVATSRLAKGADVWRPPAHHTADATRAMAAMPAPTHTPSREGVADVPAGVRAGRVEGVAACVGAGALGGCVTDSRADGVALWGSGAATTGGVGAVKGRRGGPTSAGRGFGGAWTAGGDVLGGGGGTDAARVGTKDAIEFSSDRSKAPHFVQRVADRTFI